MSEEITKDMIGCLCWFKNKEDKKSIIGILKGITSDNCYVNDFWCKSEECRPVKPDEVKFYDLRNLKDLEVILGIIESKNDRINKLEAENYLKNMYDKEK